MITQPERQRLVQVLSGMKPEARVMHIARLRATPGKASEVAVLEGIHQQLCFAERAASTPLEVNGQFRQTATAAEQTKIEYPPYWTPERVKYAVCCVGGIAGIGAGIYYVVIPAAVAVISALVSVASVVAPWIAGGFLALVILKESFFGEKKTGGYPAQEPPKQSGNVYNIYIGENQNVRINP